MNTDDSNEAESSSTEDRFAAYDGAVALFVILSLATIAIGTLIDRQNTGWSRRHPEIWLPLSGFLLILGCHVLVNIKRWATYWRARMSKFLAPSDLGFQLFIIAWGLGAILFGLLFLLIGCGAFRLN